MPTDTQICQQSSSTMDSHYKTFLKPPLVAEDNSYKAILLQRLMTVFYQPRDSPRDNWAGLVKNYFFFFFFFNFILFLNFT